jgi:hypothetical protein
MMSREELNEKLRTEILAHYAEVFHMTVDEFIKWKIKKSLSRDALQQARGLVDELGRPNWDWKKDKMKRIEEEGWIEECYNFIKSKPDFIVEGYYPCKELPLGSQAFAWAKYIKRDPSYEGYNLY